MNILTFQDYKVHDKLFVCFPNELLKQLFIDEYGETLENLSEFNTTITIEYITDLQRIIDDKQSKRKAALIDEGDYFIFNHPKTIYELKSQENTECLFMSATF